MTENASRNDTLKSAVLVAAIIGAVAGPMAGAVVSLGARLDRMESRVNASLSLLDVTLQREIEVAKAEREDAVESLDVNSAERHEDQQVEIFRLRDRLDQIPALEAEIEVLKAEVDRLRGGVP